MMTNAPWTVAALYQFARVQDPRALADLLRTACTQNGICGTLIVAHEGINGTIAAPDADAMEKMLESVRAHFDAPELKYSQAAEKPFRRMKIKVKPEIVTMRRPGVDPSARAGIYVEPDEWNTIISDPDVTVIDTRNAFEVALGTFEGAIDPGTTMFPEFPDFVERHLNPARHKKIAMFCTGGIRCEKASSFMIAEGFETVYHLKGGILKYLETIPEEKSKWRGQCFVFDERETLGHGLVERKGR